MYESPWLAPAVGVEAKAAGGPAPAATWELEELKRLKRKEIECHIEQGTLLDAWARLLVYVRPPGDPADERPFNLFRRMVEEMKPEKPALARGAEGGDQAPGVRARARRGARDRRAAQAGARYGASAGAAWRPRGR